MLSDFLGHVKAFALSKVLLSAIELDILKIINQENLSWMELKKRLNIADTPIADSFLDVLIAFEIIAEKKGKLTLLPLGQSIIPVYDSIKSWNKEMSLYFSSLNDLTTMLKSGRYQDSVLTGYWCYKKSSERKRV